MKSFLMLVLSLSAPLAILAGPPSKDKDKDLSTNPGRPFQSLELRLDRNYQATLDVPGLVVDNLKDLFPAPRVGALRWISPDWKVGLNSFATGLQRIVTRIFVFNPDPVFPVKVIVKTFLPDGTPVAFRHGEGHPSLWPGLCSPSTGDKSKGFCCHRSGWPGTPRRGHYHLHPVRP